MPNKFDHIYPPNPPAEQQPSWPPTPQGPFASISVSVPSLEAVWLAALCAAATKPDIGEHRCLAFADVAVEAFRARFGKGE